MEYHAWRNLYPPGAHSVENVIQKMGIGIRNFCELCRKIREMRKNGRHQYYQSVCLIFKNGKFVLKKAKFQKSLKLQKKPENFRKLENFRISF